MRTIIIALIVLGVTFWLGTLCNNPASTNQVVTTPVFDTVQCIIITTDVSFTQANGELITTPVEKMLTKEQVTFCYQSMLGQKKLVDKLLSERAEFNERIQSLHNKISKKGPSSIERELYNIAYDAAYDATH